MLPRMGLGSAMRISRQRCQDPNGAKDARIQGVQNTLVSMASLCTLKATHGISVGISKRKKLKSCVGE